MSTLLRTTTRRRSTLLLAAAAGALLLAGCGGAATTVETVTVTASPVPASSEAAPVVESPSAEAPAASETPTPEASPSVTPEPTAEPTVFKGRGDKILKFDSGPFIATLTHAGSSNFVAYSLTTDLDEDDLLVNEIGRYKGTVLAGSDEYGGMKIEADGSWTLSMIPIEDADIKTGPVKGKGSAVFYWGSATT
jgi:hypothetical protein